MIEYDLVPETYTFVKRCLDEYNYKNKKPIKNYFEAFFFIRNEVINKRNTDLNTYEKIQDAIVLANFKLIPRNNKLKAGFLETLWFNVKMKKIHGESWKFWDPMSDYYLRYQS
jgi:hypothetical protein